MQRRSGDATVRRRKAEGSARKYTGNEPAIIVALDTGPAVIAAGCLRLASLPPIRQAPQSCEPLRVSTNRALNSRPPSFVSTKPTVLLPRSRKSTRRLPLLPAHLLSPVNEPEIDRLDRSLFFREQSRSIQFSNRRENKLLEVKLKNYLLKFIRSYHSFS